MTTLISPNTLGAIILVVLVAFAEVRSYQRAKRFKSQVFAKTVATRGNHGLG